jgi:hypothetical protein
MPKQKKTPKPAPPVALADSAPGAQPGDSAESLLHKLAEVRAQSELLAMDKQELLQQILAPVQEQLRELEAEFAPKSERLQELEAELLGAVKTAVLARGASVRAGSLHAVYLRGRESWDSRGLQGYAQAHPEVLHFQKVGESSVSIRRAASE